MNKTYDLYLDQFNPGFEKIVKNLEVKNGRLKIPSISKLTKCNVNQKDLDSFTNMVQYDRLSKNSNFTTIHKDNHIVNQNKKLSVHRNSQSKEIKKIKVDACNQFKINLYSKYKLDDTNNEDKFKNKQDCHNDSTILDSQFDIEINKRESLRESILVINKGTSIIVDKPEVQKIKTRNRHGQQDLSTSILFENEQISHLKVKSKEDKNTNTDRQPKVYRPISQMQYRNQKIHLNNTEDQAIKLNTKRKSNNVSQRLQTNKYKTDIMSNAKDQVKLKSSHSCPDIKIPNVNKQKEFNIKSRSQNTVKLYGNKDKDNEKDNTNTNHNFIPVSLNIDKEPNSQIENSILSQNNATNQKSSKQFSDFPSRKSAAKHVQHNLSGKQRHVVQNTNKQINNSFKENDINNSSNSNLKRTNNSYIPVHSIKSLACTESNLNVHSQPRIMSYKDSTRYQSASIKDMNITCDTSFERNPKLFDTFSPLKSEQNQLFTNTNEYLHYLHNFDNDDTLNDTDTHHKYRSSDSVNKVNSNLKDEQDQFKKWSKNASEADKCRLYLGIGNQIGRGGACGFGHGRLIKQKDLRTNKGGAQPHNTNHNIRNLNDFVINNTHHYTTVKG